MGLPLPQRILVTGGRGFLGRVLVREVKREFPRAALVAADLVPPRPQDEPGPVVDLTKTKAWRQLGGPFDLILHLAAFIPQHPREARRLTVWRLNLALAENLYQACQKWQPAKVVVASSIALYPMGIAPVLSEDLVPQPDSLYGTAKLAAEKLISLAQSPQTQVVCLRLSSLYGPEQSPGSVLPLFLRRALAGENLRLFGQGRRTQDFIHVLDAAAGFLAAARTDSRGAYNLGSGIPVSMLTLAETIINATGSTRSRIEFSEQPEEGPTVAVDITRATRELGFKPKIDLAEGIRNYVKALLAG